MCANKHGMHPFEKLSTNADILIVIYKFLDFQDQVMLSCASHNLKWVFVNYIHKQAFKFLQIVQHSEYCVVVNEVDDSQAILLPSQLKCFMQVYAKDVQEFSFGGAAKLFNTTRFHNLTCLRYGDVKITAAHLKLVAEGCLRLQSLHLDGCRTMAGDILMLGTVYLNINTLMAFSNLKHLSVMWRGCAVDEYLDYDRLGQLVTSCQLKSLNISNILKPNGATSTTDIVAPDLKELTITSDKGSGSFWSFLQNCENLVKLTLKVHSCCVTEQHLKSLVHSCKNLEILKFQDIEFERIETFTIPPKVSELTLNGCLWLSYKNLQQILTQLNITKFDSEHTIYSRVDADSTDFTMSPLINTLGMDCFFIKDFETIYQNNPNLIELTVYEHLWDDDDDSIHNNYNVALMYFQETCKKLKSLILRGWCFVPLECILQLGSLAKLQVNILYSPPAYDWPYLWGILKHPTLTELIIDCPVYSSCYLGSRDSRAVAFPTNIKLLTLSYVVFKRGLDFWLDLFARNRLLKLICIRWEHKQHFLKRMLSHDKFPTDLQTIDICGSNMSCDQLRTFLDSNERHHHRCGIKHRLILSRNR